MKKKLFLFAVLSTAILSAVFVIQFNGNSCDDLLNANVEALAGPGVVIPCQLAESERCEYPEFAVGPEGELVIVGVQIKYNMRKINPSN